MTPLPLIDNIPIHLVSCVSQKRPTRAPAKDLYTSDWFQKARAYVEGRNGRWYILSALYGLIEPEQLIDPYDLSLNGSSRAFRIQWSVGVRAQLEERIGPAAPIVFLAGRQYREFLLPWALGRSSIPMEGLGIGEQKAWLKRNTDRPV